MNRLQLDDFWSLALRLSLASIWLNAGVLGKLLSPGFLNPNSNDYVGLTILYFAQGSPIRGFLYAVAFPHPILTGILVMIGEISFGLSFLLGLGVRLSGTTAFATNLTSSLYLGNVLRCSPFPLVDLSLSTVRLYSFLISSNAS